MGKWEMVRLSDCCNFIDYRGKTPEKSEAGIPLITAKNVRDNAFSIEPQEFIPTERYESVMTRGIPKENDVLFTTEAPLGNVCRIPHFNSRFAVGQRIIVMQPKQDKLISEFLEYALKSKAFQSDMWTHSSGSTVKGIRSKELVKLFIPLPDLKVQKHVANTLYGTTELLAMREQQLAELDNLIKSTFYDMFGDPANNEMGWKVVELGLVAKLQGGFAFRSKDYVDNGIKLVQISNVHKDTLTWEEINYLPIDYLTKFSAFMLQDKDIVLAMTRPIIKSLDAVKIAVVSKKDVPCLLNQRVGRFEYNHDVINSTFLLELCRSQYFKNAIELFGSNSLQPNVSSKQVESIMCFLPPLYIQTQFAEIVTKIEEQKALVKNTIDETQHLFDSLMSEYFE